MLSIRSSFVPIVARCPRSARTPDLQISITPDEACNLGSAAHEAIGNYIVNRPRDLHVIALKWMVDEDELTKLYAQCVQRWAALADHYPEPLVEQPLHYECPIHGIELTGHADVISIMGNQVRILDWKTGWADDEDEYREQLTAYAFLAVQMTDAESAEATICWPRRGADNRFTWAFSRRWLEEWWVDLCTRIKTADGYEVGAHCRRCPHEIGCPARRKLIQESISRFALAAEQPEGWIGCDVGEMVPEELMSLHGKIALVKGACDQAMEALKALLRQGSVRAADGTELRLVHQERKEVLWTRQAAEALRQALGEGALAQCISVSKAKLERAVAATVERGKGKRVAELLQHLDSLGAIRRREFEVVELAKTECSGR